MKLLIYLCIIVIFNISCGNSCRHLIKYQTNTIKIKALKTVIAKENLDIGDMDFDKKHREANDSLKTLDRLLFEACCQINQINDKKIQNIKRQDYIDNLMKFLQLSIGFNDTLSIRENETINASYENKIEKSRLNQEFKLSKSNPTYIEETSNIVITFGVNDPPGYFQIPSVCLQNDYCHTILLNTENSSKYLSVFTGYTIILKQNKKKYLIVVKNIDNTEGTFSIKQL